ncbi:MAG: DNA polymerase II large subunit, partial [Candidatus Thermoplasmatota archaeon]|nr:DNA polymerase II large subunit [Candidatus Thermoplasmatota archaeon]MBU1941668.1 DNA polymerase II large subunit [Candidatus Thermoplasmatota archaeon]
VKKLKLKEWEFLEHFISKSGDQTQDSSAIPQILPSTKYIGEVIAGRPVLSHPSRKGGFRLRYGRARTAGLASTAINPATMYLLDGFITVGTQMKTERPGKGTIGTPCDQIEGPIILLHNGDLIQVNTLDGLRRDVKKIIDLGELLIPYGEFIENNALLPDASYVYEWWIQELQQKLHCLPEVYTRVSITQADAKTQQLVETAFQKPINLQCPTPEEAFTLAEQYQIPLHPWYNLFWHDITSEQLHTLQEYILKEGSIETEKGIRLKLPFSGTIKEILIELGALHQQREGFLILDRYAHSLIRCCGLAIDNNLIITTSRYQNTNDSIEPIINQVSQLAGISIRARAPFRIGTRMGRPEKASARKMRPPPHVLFPLGNYGGNQRLVRTAAENKTIEIEAGKRKCRLCNKTTFTITCICGGHTDPLEGRIETYKIDLTQELSRACVRLKERTHPETIKGVIGTISKHKTPEPLEKGILRAKQNVHVFKDGTIRFDMTDAPLTHFRPREIGVSIKKIKELGYTKDYLGVPLTSDDQICELRAQDVIVSISCAEFFMQVAKFIDELLTKFYKLDRFYKIRRLQDLVGHLVIGLAPHTSAGALARIIGFTSAQVCYGHPFFHATKRRNADGDEDGLMMVMDALLNFSHSYIPDKRGGRMDLPLILTTRIDPAEVDKEAHNLDTLARYPLAFYEQTILHAHSKKLEPIMGLVAHRIGTELQYEQFDFTHDTTDISAGPKESTYKTLKTMMDKMNVQLDLAAKIRAVDEADVAYKVIERHFLPDILGNLRAFSKQSVRCPQCNTTFRRIPLKGVCNKCSGRLTLTVHEMSVKKYLDISRKIAEKYNLPMYAQQRINLVEKSINSLFRSDRIRITTIDEFCSGSQGT